ncbi:RNA-directed DNA polymerase, eukaryota, reverse transcriptase zinc-binding domain protein [Tanacetum coccineum]
MFTWMNKTGTKLSKLDRFLVSDGVLHAHSHMQVTVLDKVWSDHNPILLHSKNSDFGQTLFKLFHSWFDRIGFDDVVKEAWNYFSFEVHGSIVTFHDKFSGLQTHLKLWYSRTKDSEHSRKQKGLDKFESMDLIQKAQIKWDVEGDENSKFFHATSKSLPTPKSKEKALSTPKIPQTPKKFVVKSPIPIRNCCIGLANKITWEMIVNKTFGVLEQEKEQVRMGKRKLGV